MSSTLFIKPKHKLYCTNYELSFEDFLIFDEFISSTVNNNSVFSYNSTIRITL